MIWFFQASFSDCSNPRLCCLLLCILPSPYIFPNPHHSQQIGSSAHLGVRYLYPIISDCHTRSLSHLGVAHLRPKIPITHSDFLSFLVAVLLHAHIPNAPLPPFRFPRVFQGVPKLFSCRIQAQPHLPTLPPSFIPCLPCTYFKYRTQRHALRHGFLQSLYNLQ